MAERMVVSGGYPMAKTFVGKKPKRNIYWGYEWGNNLHKKDLKISDVQIEILVGTINIYSLLGSAMAGRTSDWLGRRITIIFASVIFFVGAIVMGFASNYAILMLGRFVAGLGVGYALMIAPVYAAEVAPASSRGFLTSFPEVFINFGVLLGYLSNYAFAKFSLKWVGASCLELGGPIYLPRPCGFRHARVPSLASHARPPRRCQEGSKKATTAVVASERFARPPDPPRPPHSRLRPSASGFPTSGSIDAVARARGCGLGVAMNRFTSGVILMTFISLYKTITIGGAFYLFTGIAVELDFLLLSLLETRGRTLEDMEVLFGTFFRWRTTMRDLKKKELNTNDAA
ncbi:hypothetical protein DH2020_013924 [Rehmannia glutinosa]|uniref:Major facilitator superfamily (MFS) profile domain-containing protein n=1 Tax=Rehmannia glutinosa TaxID=99300 RepID=A0ABR0WYE0_REHGL